MFVCLEEVIVYSSDNIMSIIKMTLEDFFFFFVVFLDLRLQMMFPNFQPVLSCFMYCNTGHISVDHSS